MQLQELVLNGKEGGGGGAHAVEDEEVKQNWENYKEEYILPEE